MMSGWRTSSRRSGLLLAGVLVACEPEAPTEADAPALGGAVVAVVADRPITTDAVAAAARRLGTSPRQALDRLIDEEVLAEAARRRGINAPPAEFLQDQARAQLVLRSIEREVDETAVSPDDIAARRGEAMASLRTYPQRDLRELTFRIPSDASMETVALVEQVAAEAHAALDAVGTTDPGEAAFGRVVERARARLPGVELEVRARMTVERRTEVSDPFLERVFALGEGLAPSVLRSPRGVHVLVVLGIRAAFTPDPTEVDEEATRMALIDRRRVATERLLRESAATRTVRIQETLVTRILQDSRWFSADP